jgi:hypothetical protein
MSDRGRRPHVSTVRHHTTELIAVLLAGIGLGVGIAALVLGHTGSSQVLVSARARPAPKSTKPLGPATAGTQPGREEAARVGEPATPAEVGETAGSKTLIPALTAGAKASFTRLENSLPGHLELAVAPLGTEVAEILGGDTPAHGWSTTKVPVLAALIEARGESGLTSEEMSLAHSAITVSSNEAIIDLFHDLEQIEGNLLDASSYVQELLVKSGDDQTVVATAPPPPGAVTTFGQTEWSPSNAVKFFSALARGCLLQLAQTRYVLGLMQKIAPEDSWGLGSAGFARVAFKGGWGPEPDRYLVRQSGIIEVGTPRAVAVSIVYFAPSFEEGQLALTDAAVWLHRYLRPVSRTPVACPAG